MYMYIYIYAYPYMYNIILAVLGKQLLVGFQPYNFSKITDATAVFVKLSPNSSASPTFHMLQFFVSCSKVPEDTKLFDRLAN